MSGVRDAHGTPIRSRGLERCVQCTLLSYERHCVGHVRSEAQTAMHDTERVMVTCGLGRQCTLLSGNARY
eukprot:2692583-Rhodomonas_salina.1